MKTRYLFTLVAAISCQLAFANKTFWGINKNNTSQPPNEATVNQWMHSTIGFEKNIGQIQNFNGERINDVLFRAKLSEYSIYITPKGVSYVLYQTEKKQESVVNKHAPSLSIDTTSKFHYARFDINLQNATISNANVVYENPLPGYINYYLPSCPDGALNVVSYQKVTVKDVYPGIDWVWFFKDGQMHYEFYVHPGTDPQQIQLKVNWADYEIKENGKKLVFSTPLGNIEDGELKVYEKSSKKPIAATYKEENKQLCFAIANPNPNAALIIDPPLALVWSTYYGGSYHEAGNTITTDASGNVFVMGYTSSTDFPTQDPGGGAYFQGTGGGTFYDDFILKFDNNGVRQWATYYGGSGNDYVYSITTDALGNLFVTGETGSTDFPTHNPGGGSYFQGILTGNYSIFILKFNNNGVRQWATYYGGNSIDRGYSIATDASGNVFVTGWTESTNFPTQDPGGGAYFQGTGGGTYYEVFILKFDNNGIRQWATYYGGSTSNDYGYAVTTDTTGNVFVTGRAYSIDFPTQDPGGGAFFQGSKAVGSDIFILKFNNNGVRQWATYYGGSNDDESNSITTDASGNVWITGWTTSTDFPTDSLAGGYFQSTNAGIWDIFILKFDNNGVRLWATYYGGSSSDYGNSIITDTLGNVFVTGQTKSTDFTTQDPGGGAYFDGTGDGTTSYWDVFILKFSNNGVRQWATYYAGSSNDVGYSIATDALGNLFVTGQTVSTDFPTQNPGGGSYFQGTGGGTYYDAFILKFGDNYCSNTTSTINPTACDSYTSPSGNYTWTNSSTYMDTIPNAAGCDSIITINLTINTVDTSVTANPPILTANATGAVYQWVDCNNGFSAIAGATNQSYTATSNGDYAVIVTQNGCTDTSVCYAVVNVDINEPVWLNEISIYPNPTQNNLRVTLPQNVLDAQITLYNALGQVVFTKQNVNTIIVEIPVKGSRGVYFVEIKASDQQARFKVVKE